MSLFNSCGQFGRAFMLHVEFGKIWKIVHGLPFGLVLNVDTQNQLT